MATGHPATVPLAWLTVYAVGAIGGDDRLDDGRLGVRCPPGQAALPALHRRRHRRQLRRDAGVRARSRARSGRETLIVLEAILLASSGCSIVGGRADDDGPGAAASARPVDRRRPAGSGFDAVVRSPLMRLVAVAYVLLAILMFSVTYPFLLAASETFTSEADLATALGLLSAAVTATSFVVSLVLANRVYARFGVAGAALLLPLVYLGGFGAVAGRVLDRDRGALPVHPAGDPARPLERRLERVLQRRPDRAPRPGPRLQRRGPGPGRDDPVGRPAAGGRLAASRATRCSGSGASTALACTIVVVGIRRRYAASLLRRLRAGLGEQVLEGGPGLAALTARSGRRRAPWSTPSAPRAGRPPDGRRTCSAGRPSAGRRSTALDRRGAVDDDADPSVRVAALEALGRARRPADRGRRGRGCLADPDDRVRAAAIRALGASSADPTRRSARCRGSTSSLDDPSPAVRAAMACLFGSRGPDPTLGARSSPSCSRTRTASARVAGLDADPPARRPGPARARTRALLGDPSPEVRVAAIEALAASPRPARSVPALVAALDDDAAVGPTRPRRPRSPGSRRHRPALVDVLLATDPARPGGRARGPARPRPGGPGAGHRLDQRRGSSGRPTSAGLGTVAGRCGPGATAPAQPTLDVPRATSSTAASGGSIDPTPRRAGRPRRARGRRRHPPLPSVGRPGDPGAGDRGARLDRRPTPVRRARPAARGRRRPTRRIALPSLAPAGR